MKILMYTVAFICGVSIRSIIALINGWEYSINGIDLVCGLATITMVWSFKDILSRAIKSHKERRNNK